MKATPLIRQKPEPVVVPVAPTPIDPSPLGRLSVLRPHSDAAPVIVVVPEAPPVPRKVSVPSPTIVNGHAVRPHTVINSVFVRFGVDVDEITSNRRTPRVVSARAVMVCALREFTTRSYPEIAKLMGRPNHSSSITSHQRLIWLLTLDFGDARRAVPFSDGTKDIGDLLAAVRADIMGETNGKH